jgi:4-amino-4-deoxy-L-arabinose transferase-like glycosyltransferase
MNLGIDATGSGVHPEPRAPGRRGAGWLSAVVALLLAGVAAFQVVRGGAGLSATFDESLHIAAGMEWLDKGTYTDAWEQPPLARIALALGPYLRGLRAQPGSSPTERGYAILYSAGDYRSNLASARRGNLLFLGLACLAVFLWGRRWFGGTAAVWAVALFASLPPVLAHAGLATVDMACAATVMLALYSLVRYLEVPAWPRLVFLGVALSIALLSKFSSLPFIGLCLVCAVACLLLRKRGSPLLAVPWRNLAWRVLIVFGVVFALAWAGYRFSLAPLSPHVGAHAEIDRAFARQPLLRKLAAKAVETPVPLGQAVMGIREVALHNARGHDSYLFGEYRSTGWWCFFPVVVGVKTPIGFLLLVGLGFLALARGFGGRPWQQQLTAIFPLAIMLVCMKSRIDLGVRHILPIYPLLAVIGGFAISESFSLARRATPVILAAPILLFAWLVADSWMARADYLAYFNEFAGRHPERILAESDLDWGQDLDRLSRRLKELRVDHVSIGYFGTAPLEKADLPPYSLLSAETPVTHGYVAVSVHMLWLEYARDGSYAWLHGRAPLEKIGKSIYLYDMDR